MTLQLPIRVGVSFLPSDAGTRRFQPGAIDREKCWTRSARTLPYLPYVAKSSSVPDLLPDMARTDGLAQIEQLSRLYRLDLLALVSYDQRIQVHPRTIARSRISPSSARYFVRGDRNETHTLLDLAVIDPTGRRW